MLLASLLILAQSNLDAPVAPHPTVRTEIHRGYLAAQACTDASRGGHEMEFFSCISDADRANQAAMGSSNQPFAAGLYFGAKIYGDVLANSAPRYQLLYSPSDIELLQSNAQFYTNQRDRYRDALKLSDDDLAMAALNGD